MTYQDLKELAEECDIALIGIHQSNAPWGTVYVIVECDHQGADLSLFKSRVHDLTPINMSIKVVS